jgi:hypothetical protein
MNTPYLIANLFKGGKIKWQNLSIILPILDLTVMIFSLKMEATVLKRFWWLMLRLSCRLVSHHRRNVYRGKNLGPLLPQLKGSHSPGGTFDDLFSEITGLFRE